MSVLGNPSSSARRCPFGGLWRQIQRWACRQKSHLTVFLIYVVVSCAYTYPLAFKMNSSLFVNPERPAEDVYGHVYLLWFKNYAREHGISPELDHLAGYPSGLSFPLLPALRFSHVAQDLLTQMSDEVFAYNFTILSSFIFSAFFTYLLALKITGSQLGAFLSGLIFSFCPNHVVQASCHIDLARTQWIALYVLALLGLELVRNWEWAVFTGLAYGVVFLINFYHGFFTLIFTMVFFIFKALWVGVEKALKKQKSAEHKPRANLETAARLSLAGLVAVCLILPFEFALIAKVVSPDRAQSSVGQYMHPYDDLTKYAGRFKDYFRPLPEHPVWGAKDSARAGQQEGGLYLGFLVLALSAAGMLFALRREKNDDRDHWRQSRRFIASFFAFALVTSFYITAPPKFRVGQITVPAPSHYLGRLAPMFRVYARYGFVANLSVAMLAGFGVAGAVRRLKSRSARIGALAGLSVLTLFEYTLVPPWLNMDISKTPDVYLWLRSQPRDIVVAEYPLGYKEGLRYLFYQRIHRKRLMNLADHGSFSNLVAEKANDLREPEAAGLLRYIGVDYVVVHKKDYPDISGVPGLRVLRDFPSEAVFEVTADVPQAVGLPYGFGQLEKRPDGTLWQWIGDEAGILVVNRAGKEMDVEISFDAKAFYKSRVLDVRLGGRTLYRSSIAPEPETSVTLRSVQVPRGRSRIVFQAIGGATRVGDVLQTRRPDRRLSFGFHNLQIRFGPKSEEEP